MQLLLCQHCKYEWLPRTPNPLKCPKCQRILTPGTSKLFDDASRVRKYYAERRKEALQHLGNKCVRCGNTDPRVLQIDHVNGGGTSQRRTPSWNVYAELRKILDTIPGKIYQLLCANCNLIKKAERGETRKAK